MRESRGKVWGLGVRTPPLKNHNDTGFLSNTGPDPLKNHKATEPTFNVGPTSAASETPFQWRSAGGPMMVRPSQHCYIGPLVASMLCRRSDRLSGLSVA